MLHENYSERTPINESVSRLISRTKHFSKSEISQTDFNKMLEAYKTLCILRTELTLGRYEFRETDLKIKHLRKLINDFEVEVLIKNGIALLSPSNGVLLNH